MRFKKERVNRKKKGKKGETDKDKGREKGRKRIPQFCASPFLTGQRIEMPSK